MRNILLASILAVFFAGCASQSSPPAIESGLAKGDDIIPWNPIHVAGPDAGTNACPVCTYEMRPAVVVFTRDGNNAAALATRLQDLVRREKSHELKSFVVVLNSTPEKLKQLGLDLKITDIGLCCPDPQTRAKDLKKYKINPAAQNTLIIYKDEMVQGDFVNVDAADFDKVEAAVGKLW